MLAASGAGARGARAEARERTGRSRWQTVAANAKPRPLAEIESADVERRRTGSRELDRVLGGGLVSGSLLLVGGDPGIGKSTLLLQVAMQLTAPGSGEAPILYIAGEESEEQRNRPAGRRRHGCPAELG